MTQAPYVLEFFEDDDGLEPCRVFLRGLEPAKRRIAIAGLEEVLAWEGKDVCASDFGKPLGDGLFEFRIDLDEQAIHDRGHLATADTPPASRSNSHEGVLLRIFFHPYGEKIVLLLAGYDKLADPKKRRQEREIKAAQKYLGEFKRQHARAGTKPNKTKQADIAPGRRLKDPGS